MVFASRALLRFAPTAARLAGGGHGHGPASPAFHGFVQPEVQQPYRRVAIALGSLMWFWLFYRTREDGAVLMGWRKPFDHGDHGQSEHHEVEAHH